MEPGGESLQHVQLQFTFAGLTPGIRTSSPVWKPVAHNQQAIFLGPAVPGLHALYRRGKVFEPDYLGPCSWKIYTGSLWDTGFPGVTHQHIPGIAQEDKAKECL